MIRAGNVTVVNTFARQLSRTFWIFSTSHNCFLMARAATQNECFIWFTYCFTYT